MCAVYFVNIVIHTPFSEFQCGNGNRSCCNHWGSIKTDERTSNQQSSKAHEQSVADCNISSVSITILHYLISLGQTWQGCFITTVARRGKFNIDATLGKEDTTLATPFLLLSCIWNQTPYPASPPSLSRVLVLTTHQILALPRYMQKPKSLEISPWNHQEWGVLMSLRNSRYIWTSAHLCRWNNAAWDCRGQWAPCHQKAGQFWRGNKRQGAESDQAQLKSCSNGPTLQNPPVQTSLKQLCGFVP